jgi:hypothetical protein
LVWTININKKKKIVQEHNIYQGGNGSIPYTLNCLFLIYFVFINALIFRGAAYLFFKKIYNIEVIIINIYIIGEKHIYKREKYFHAKQK